MYGTYNVYQKKKEPTIECYMYFPTTYKAKDHYTSHGVAEHA